MKLFKTIISTVLILSMLVSVCYADFIFDAPVLTNGSEVVKVTWGEKNVIGSFAPDDINFDIELFVKGKKPVDYTVAVQIDEGKERQIAKITALPYKEISKNIKISNVDNGKHNIKLMVKKGDEVVYLKEESISVIDTYEKQFMDEIAKPAINMVHCDDTDLVYIQNMGFKEFRDSYYWRKAEKSKGNYKNEQDEPTQQKVWDAGMRTVAAGGYGNPKVYPMWEEDVGQPLATKDRDTAGPHVQEGIMAYVNFVKYGLFDLHPEVKIFEVWNEPNLTTFQPYATREHDYLNLLKATTAGVRNEYKNNRIGGFVYAVQGQNELLDRYFESGAYPYLDVMTYHFYNTSVNIDDNKFYEKKMETIAGFPLKYGGWKKVYLTEMGWPNGTSSVGVTESTSAHNMAKLYTIGDAVGQQVAMFNAKNGGDDISYSENNFGIFKSATQSRELKEQYFAIAHRNTMLNGGVFVGEADLGDEEIRAFVYLKEGKPVMQVWDGSAEREELEYTFSGERVRVTDMNGTLLSEATDTVTLKLQPIYIEGLSDKYLYNAARADLKRDKAGYLETYAEMLPADLLKDAEKVYDSAIAVCDEPTEDTVKAVIDGYNSLGQDIIKAFADDRLEDLVASRATYELSKSVETVVALYMKVYDGDAMKSLKYTTKEAQAKADKLYRDKNTIMQYSDAILTFAVDVETDANIIIDAGYKPEEIKAYVAGWSEIIKVYCDWFEKFSDSEKITNYALTAQVLPSSTSGYINDTLPIKINLNNVTKATFEGRVAIFDEAGNELATTNKLKLAPNGHNYVELPVKLTEDKERLHICYIDTDENKLTDDLLRITIKDKLEAFVIPSSEILEDMESLKLKFTNLTDEPLTVNIKIDADENITMGMNTKKVTMDANAEQIMEFPISSIKETRYHYYTFKYEATGENGEILASGEAPINFTAIVEAKEAIDVKSFTGDASDWEDAYPIYINAPSDPNDKALWESADASTRVFLKYDDKNLYMLADVYDDRQWNIFTGSSLWNGDCIQISIDTLNTDSVKKYDDDDFELGIAKGALGDELQCWQGKVTTGQVDYVKIIRNDEIGVTRYLAAFPLSELTNIKAVDGFTFGFNIGINDGDALARDDYFEFTGGTTGSKDPSLYMDFTFRDKSGGSFVKSQGDNIFSDKIESKILK